MSETQEVERELGELRRRVADLDRCMHGRHVRDLCFECREKSDGEVDNLGNPHLGDVVGYGLGARPITVRDLLVAIGRDGTSQ